MSINTEYYGTLEEAQQYFDMRLHEYAWSDAVVADRPKALWAATQIIDTLNFKGYKASTWATLQSLGLKTLPSSTVACGLSAELQQIRDAEASQPLEFPRGNDTEVPEAIRRACYEIAYSLLDGKDPELELENLGITSQGYSSVRTTYNRSQVPLST